MNRVVLTGCLLAGSLILTSVATAAPVELIGGWEGASVEEGYGFATLGTAIAAGPAIVFPLRIGGDYLTYRYQDGGATVRVRAPGASFVAGPRFSGRHGSVTLSGGAEVRWERRERGAAGWGQAVAQGGAVFEGMADLRFGRRFVPFLLATYSGSARYLFTRSAIRFQCSNLDWQGPVTWNAGVELTGQGNGDTNAYQVGGLIECALPRARLTLSGRAGYKSTDSGDGARRGDPYGGVGLYRRF